MTSAKVWIWSLCLQGCSFFFSSVFLPFLASRWCKRDGIDGNRATKQTEQNAASTVTTCARIASIVRGVPIMAAMYMWTANIATSALIVLGAAFVKKFAKWMVCRKNELYTDTIANCVRMSENLKNGVHDLSKAFIVKREACIRQNRWILRTFLMGGKGGGGSFPI